MNFPVVVFVLLVAAALHHPQESAAEVQQPEFKIHLKNAFEDAAKKVCDKCTGDDVNKCNGLLGTLKDGNGKTVLNKTNQIAISLKTDFGNLEKEAKSPEVQEVLLSCAHKLGDACEKTAKALADFEGRKYLDCGTNTAGAGADGLACEMSLRGQDEKQAPATTAQTKTTNHDFSNTCKILGDLLPLLLLLG